MQKSVAKVPPHLNTHPDQNPNHARRQPNPHLTPDMERMFAAQHAAKNKRLGAQAPPRTSDKPAYVDLLDMLYDTIEGQNFAVLSFLSPENAIQRREEFLYQEFVQWNDFSTSYKVCSDYADFMAAKYGLDADVMQADFKDFMDTESHRLKDVDVTAKFSLFCKKNGKELQKKYEGLNGRETAVRGLNVLGVVATQEEAVALVKTVAAEHTHHLDLMYGRVGQWLAWNPTDLIKREYLEPELNELMAGREVKEARKTEAFEQRKKGMIQSAAEQNQTNAEKHGAKTTMVIGADGRPVNTTRDDHGNLLADLDGNGFDMLLDRNMTMDEVVAEATAAGRNVPAKPIDAETGEEALGTDELADELRRLALGDDEEGGKGGDDDDAAQEEA